MNKAISPGSEFSGIGFDLPIEPQYFVESAAASGSTSSPPAIQILPASATGSADAKPDSKPKPAYPAPAELPTQQGPQGLRFDFNDGARVFCPDGEQHPWRSPFARFGYWQRSV